VVVFGGREGHFGRLGSCGRGGRARLGVSLGIHHKWDPKIAPLPPATGYDHAPGDWGKLPRRVGFGFGFAPGFARPTLHASGSGSGSGAPSCPRSAQGLGGTCTA
jgi:hypothetical protein